jgi:hypothetical protein
MITYFIFRKQFKRLTILAELSSIQLGIVAFVSSSGYSTEQRREKIKKILLTYQKKILASSSG